MAKTIFDHLKSLTINKSITWESLTEEDKKSFSVFMINRYLSMNMKLISDINVLQFHSHNLESKYVYKLYQWLLPKKNLFFKYIKGDRAKEYNENVVEYLVKYYECSKSEAIEYYFILTTEQITSILKMYGLDDKVIKKWSKK
ncbi:MAG TPA: hypothetical protein PLY35_08365 [Thermotogota bacterium]|nr:hypothetical protein [Thermotogota bacterium]